jgi:hypothetical protein
MSGKLSPLAATIIGLNDPRVQKLLKEVEEPPLPVDPDSEEFQMREAAALSERRALEARINGVRS